MRPSALAAFLIFAATGISALGQAQAASAYKPADQSWVPKSNAYTQTLLDIQNRYSPESDFPIAAGQQSVRPDYPTKF